MTILASSIYRHIVWRSTKWTNGQCVIIFFVLFGISNQSHASTCCYILQPTSWSINAFIRFHVGPIGHFITFNTSHRVFSLYFGSIILLALLFFQPQHWIRCVGGVFNMHVLVILLIAYTTPLKDMLYLSELGGFTK